LMGRESIGQMVRTEVYHVMGDGLQQSCVFSRKTHFGRNDLLQAISGH